MKRILYFFLILGFLVPSFAQQAASGDPPATKEDVEKLFVSLHLRDQMQRMMEISTKQSKQMAIDALKKKLPDVSQKDLDRINSMIDRMMKDFDLNGLLDDMIPVYQRHLTRSDVVAMQAFYETPTGQKMLREQPEMMAEAMKAVQPRMEKMMSGIMDEAQKAAKEARPDSKPSGEDAKSK